MHARSGIIYKGPSLIDGAPIAVIATLTNSNSKTGEMLQTYILRADIDPRDASKSGADISICGDCPFRGDATTDPKRKVAENRRCYVRIDQGPLLVWKSLQRGVYSDARSGAAIRDLGRDRMVRLGTYGDPAAVPAHVWILLLANSKGWTGYSHAGALSGDQWGMSFVMQSADSLDHAKGFWAQGARTFRVLGDIAEIDPAHEILCPASKEAGRRVQCADCGLCQGNAKRGKSIAIVDHGPQRRRIARAVKEERINA